VCRTVAKEDDDDIPLAQLAPPAAAVPPAVGADEGVIDLDDSLPSATGGDQLPPKKGKRSSGKKKAKKAKKAADVGEDEVTEGADFGEDEVTNGADAEADSAPAGAASSTATAKAAPKAKAKAAAAKTAPAAKAASKAKAKAKAKANPAATATPAAKAAAAKAAAAKAPNEAATTASSAASAAAVRTPFSDDVVCTYCGLSCSYKAARLTNKSCMRFKCNKCNSVTTQLSRRFKTWPLPGFAKLDAQQKQQFMRECAEGGAVEKAKERLSSSLIESETLAEGGAFQPISYWKAQGYDSQAIIDKSLPCDRQEHSVLGTTCRLRIVTQIASSTKNRKRKSEVMTAPTDEGDVQSSQDSTSSSSSSSSSDKKKKKAKKAKKAKSKKSKKSKKKEQKKAAEAKEEAKNMAAEVKQATTVATKVGTILANLDMINFESLPPSLATEIRKAILQAGGLKSAAEATIASGGETKLPANALKAPGTRWILSAEEGGEGIVSAGGGRRT
jgi:hypothetical protein